MTLARLKRRTWRVVLARHSPQEIATAFALGVWIGALPGPGLLIGIAAAFVLRLPKAATAAGCLLTNPWTGPFVYAASYKLGQWALGKQEAVQWARLLSFDHGWHIELGRVAPTLLTGSVVFGGLAAAVAYALTLYGVHSVRRWRARRMLARQRSLPLKSNAAAQTERRLDRSEDASRVPVKRKG